MRTTTSPQHARTHAAVVRAVGARVLVLGTVAHDGLRDPPPIGSGTTPPGTPGKVVGGMSEGRRDLLRRLAPQVLGALVRRFGYFDTAEDAVQEALLAAARWPQDGSR